MQNAPEMRERLFTMRISEEESSRFERVAKHYGLNVAGTIRMLMKQAEARIADDDHEQRRREAARWSRDKAYVEWLVAQVNVRRLRATFDDGERTIALADGKHSRA